jgi:Transposase DDE domain
VERLREAREALVTQAQPQEESDDAALGRRRGDELPAACTRRAERQRRAAAAAERMRTGQPRRGKGPPPVEESPADQAQSHWPEAARPIMRTNPKGWDSCGHAHVSVDATCQIRLACDVTEAANETPQAEPLAQAPLATLGHAGLARPRDATGAAQAIAATWASGADRAAAGAALEPMGCDPSMATGRQRPHDGAAQVPEEPATAPARMAAQGPTPPGQALSARRKGMVEPVCGQIKAGRGFRRFLRRGLTHIRGAWRLVGLTQNRLKMWRYGWGGRAVSVVRRLVEGLERPLSERHGAEAPPWPYTDTVLSRGVPPLGAQATCPTRGQRVASTKSRTAS